MNLWGVGASVEPSDTAGSIQVESICSERVACAPQCGHRATVRRRLAGYSPHPPYISHCPAACGAFQFIPFWRSFFIRNFRLGIPSFIIYCTNGQRTDTCNTICTSVELFCLHGHSRTLGGGADRFSKSIILSIHKIWPDSFCISNIR